MEQTCSRFKSSFPLSLPPSLPRVMELRFSDAKGFNYLSFLEQLQPSEQLEDKYKTRMTVMLSSKEAQVRGKCHLPSWRDQVYHWGNAIYHHGGTGYIIGVMPSTNMDPLEPGVSFGTTNERYYSSILVMFNPFQCDFPFVYMLFGLSYLLEVKSSVFIKSCMHFPQMNSKGEIP